MCNARVGVNHTCIKTCSTCGVKCYCLLLTNPAYLMQTNGLLYQKIVSVTLYTVNVKILLVEDTEKLARLIVENLRLNGHVVETTKTAGDALHLAEVEKYDVIILDRMLPDGVDGLEVCARLRANDNTTPILMLTALGGVDRRVEGFENGVDDYLPKPFDMRELLARVSALMRRNRETPVKVVVNAGHVSINLPKRLVFVDEKEVVLSKRLWRLLEYLALHRGETTSKEILIDRVWGTDSDVLENAVEAAIRNLRRKLGDEKGAIIQTVHGFGYRLRR